MKPRTSAPRPHPAARALVALSLAALGSSPLGASDKFTKSKEPVFPAIEPGRALVYFVREARAFLIPQPSFEIYLDDEPVGNLPQRSYLAAQVAPGQRLLWGPPQSRPLWFEFEAGRRYVIKVVEYWRTQGAGKTTSSVLASVEWSPADPASLEATVKEKKLYHVVPTESGLAELREEIPRNYPKARERAEVKPEDLTPSAEAAALPVSYDTVWYRAEKKRALLAFRARGRLEVTQDGVTFTSDEETIRVPVGDLKEVTTGFMDGDVANHWVRVAHGPAGSSSLIGFTCPPFARRSTCDTTAIYLGIRAASRGARGGAQEATLTPVEEAERAVAAAEAFLESGAMDAPDLAGALASQGRADKIRAELTRVDALLTKHLADRPDDLEALFLQVRMDRAFSLLSPVTITAGVNKAERPAAAAPGRDPQATLDRILEVSPGNGLAYMMKADLYAFFDPIKDSPVEPDKAVQFARLAVEAAPDHAPFRERLALHLVDAGREREALEIFGKGGDEGSPVRRLLADRLRLPLPEGAAPLTLGLRYYVQSEVAAGRLEEWPYLRVVMFDLTQTASEAEAFYRRTWRDFRLYEMDKEKTKEGGTIRAYAAILEWRGEDLVPRPGKPGKKDPPAANTVMLFLGEREGGPAPSGSGGPAGATSILVVINHREVERP